ncbi:GTP-binding protein [Pontibacter sp. KCTC 32443]|uniref:sulfate adenylyltransferase subunit 1 n=1 Tax=Pontibacter TaxID=323449 RepID=UPI00164D1C03|nr:MULTISPECIES: GTP-binding protein [Pontibacter]MBC5774658.1 GTP-binding protein [Pontibacter sp. KCTC 32443]
MDILRFITAGSVDNGKSTLIGRLLHDSKAIYADQLLAMEQQSRSNAAGCIDLALLTDGLRAEREQGITIDVAYKYFSTAVRKFIIADTPGHVQYTRNMVTGASTADLAVILIDARQGVAEQTKRHTLISSLLGIPNLVVAVNKIDLVSYSRDIFEQIVADYQVLIKDFGLKSVSFIPISALKGDNVVSRSTEMSWYNGDTLLQVLEQVEVKKSVNLKDARFPVQYVIRPQTEELPDYRGYAGKIISGIYRKGDKVIILPAGTESTISKIETASSEVDEAFAPQSVVLQLSDAVDVSRGDMIVKKDSVPAMSQELEVMLCWLDNKPLTIGAKYLLQLNSTTTKAIVTGIAYRINIETLQQEPEPGQANLNDIVKASIKTAIPLPHDAYSRLRENGGAILIDENSCATVAACMIQ